MRLVAALAVLVCGTAIPAVSSEPEAFPYRAFTGAQEVYARSGPGPQYYPTAKLPPGTPVEVYRHDPGGWCAIRPPQGSFSWIPGECLEVGSDGLAEVVCDRAPARVGSQFSDIRQVIQVRLQRGELVEVTGKKQFHAGQQAQTWYKIAPPSGEFRWVHQSDIQRNAPDGSPSHRSGQPGSSLSGGAGGPGPGTAEASEPGGSSAGRISGDRLAKPGSPKAGDPASGASSDALQVPASALRRQLTPEQVQAELDEINAQLSLMLAEEPTVWYCEELRSRAEAVLEQAQTAYERGMARALLQRMADAEAIQKRYTAVAAIQLESRGSRPGAAGAGASGQHRSASEQPGEQFDGVGRLTRVVPPRLGAPRYALVDEQGNVQTYVSPAPGVNMQYYLGRRVGISGVRGYTADQNAPHLTAKHVTALDSRVR